MIYTRVVRYMSLIEDKCDSTSVNTAIQLRYLREWEGPFGAFLCI